jgi:hypothetical protein
MVLLVSLVIVACGFVVQQQMVLMLLRTFWRELGVAKVGRRNCAKWREEAIGYAWHRFEF